MRSSKFDRLAIGEMTANFLSVPAVLKAKAAFVDSTTGATHGWTECFNWSPATSAKMAELRASMEADLERIHFVDGTTTSGSGDQIAHDGLGEALGRVPQG